MPKDLRSFISQLKELLPEDIVQVKKKISPKFQVTAVQRHLEAEGRFPLLIYEKVQDLRGELSQFQVVTNLFGDRQKCAVAMDLNPSQWRMDTSMEFARRCMQPVKPVVVRPEEAPVKDVIWSGDDLDLRKLPVITHHEMDGYPYLVDAIVAADPLTGIYNSSHHRMLVRGKDELGLWMSPRHLWNYCQQAFEKGQGLPIAHVLGHHPAFYLASEALVGMNTDEYEIISGVLGEPLRLVPSEAYGEKLMVPADAELVVEGEVLPGVRDAEGPFGEFTGYYGPQRWSPVVKVKAITFRKNPYYLNIMVGHADTSILGGIPKEAGIYEEVKKSVPGVKAVHFPMSGTCRFHAYISIDKKIEGEGKVAGVASLPYHDELKHVIVVDSDVDVFNEREVLWAVATRVQAGEDVEIMRGLRGGTLDPSATIHAVGDKMIIDATKPVNRAYAEKLKVPDEVMAQMKLEDWI